MTALEQFNALNGTKAYRKDLENILQKAKDENNASLVYRISKTLNAFPDVNRFEIEIISYPEAPQGLSGAQHSGNYKEALDDCGRLRKGWKFVKGNVVKIEAKPKKEAQPKKETGPVKSKEENNSKKETKKDKKYKFVVITDDRPSRVIAVFSYTNPNIKDLRESFWKNGEGKYYETTEEGLRRYTFGMGVYPFEEAKKHIEEKYTEGKDFIYFIIEKDGGRDEAISLVEKPKKETDKTAIDEIKKIVQERLKNQGKPRLYEVLYLESAKGIFIFSWSDLGNIDGTKKKENALAKGLYQYTFPKFKNIQEKIEFSNQVWYDLLINKSLTLKRDIKEPTLNIINLYLGKNTIEDIESTSKKTSEEAKPKKGKTPKIKDFEAFDNLKSQLVAENADIPKNEVLEFLYNFVDRFEEGKTKYQFWNTPDNRPSEAVLQYKKHPFLNRIQNPSAKMRAYELTPRGYKLVEKFHKGIEYIKNTYEYKYIAGIHKLDSILRDRKNYAEEQEKDSEKATKPVKSKGEKASNFSLLQEPTKVLLKFSKDTNKEYYKKYTDEKGFVGVDFLKDNLKDLKKQAIIEDPQGFINTEDFEKSHKASKIKGIDSLKTIVSKDKLFPYLECVFIEPDTYVATDALKIVVLNRPKNDGLKTGAFYDPNFKCEKLGGCSKEEFYKDLQQGFPNYKGVLFPKPKYFTEWIPLEPLIKHLKTGLEVLTKISGLKRVFTIAIKSNIEEKRFDIKNLLDALLVLESNEAKKIRIEVIKELENNPIQIKTDNNNLAVIMPLNTGNKYSDVISPLKIAPIQLEFILNETEEKAPAKETGPVKAKEKKDKKTTEEIKKEDDLELTAEGRKALVERAMYYTRIRKKGRSYDEMYKNAKDLGEKHIDLIFNLSYLNPKGLMISDFIYDNVNKEECLKMVNWTGEARRLYPDLDNKYEDFFRHLRLQDFYKKETKEFFFKGIVDWHTKRTKRAAFLKSILDKYNIVLDYHSFNRFLIGINNNLYKNNYKELPDRDFYDFFFYLTDKLNNEFINDLKKHFVNTIEGKKIKKNAVDEEYLYKGELHQKGIEILRVVLKELEEAKGLSGVDYSQELFDDIGLNAPITEVSTERFKNMKVSELRAFTLRYYNLFLKGDSVTIEKHLKEVIFTNKAGRKIAHGEAMYSEKTAVIAQLKTLIKNSTYNNWGDRKPQDHPDILGYLNFKSKLTIDREKRHLRISIIVDKDRNLKLKSYDVGKKKSRVPQGGLPSAEGTQLSEGKDTKKSLSSKEKDENLGLNAPRHEGILKEALTEKGKLKKGWYFQDYGIIDPKGKYHPLEREFAYEYKIASDELSSRAFEQNEKRKQKGFEENIQIENNLKEFFKTLSQKNRKYFKSYKAVEIFYWAFGFEEKPTKFFTIEETNPYNEIQLKVFDKYFSNKNELFTRLENYETLRRYNLTNLGLNIITQIASFLNKEGKKVRGDVKKIDEKYGLSMPFYVQEQEKKEIQPSSNSISNKIKAFQGRNFEIFNIENPDLSTFLGEIERKNIGSNVITLTGGAGSGKTRFAFQFMNALAQNYKVGHASLEEHPESKLYFDKVTQYLDSQAQNNISVLENETLEGLENLINENEVIVIDSFAKLREMDSKFLVDKDLRKKYNGKLFLVIFQQTSDGKMRGGSTSEFDGDIILFTKTFDDPKENFVYPSKNRYNALPLSELKYSVFYQQLLQDEEQQEQPVTDLIFDVV